MSTWLRAFTRETGLDHCPAFYRDGLFYGALGAALVFWAGLWLWGSLHPIAPADLLSPVFLSLTLWQPLSEEVLFRGYLQGWARQQPWGTPSWRGLTRANILVSLLFALGHIWSHPPLWAGAVLLPSLVFGYLRDRYRSVYPSMALHMLYNAGYFALTLGQ